MGGPWRDRGFDPVAWRPPGPGPALRSRSADDRPALMRLVVGYVVAVVAAAALALGLLALVW